MKTPYEVHFTFINEEGWLRNINEVVTIDVPPEDEKKSHAKAEQVIRDKYGKSLREIFSVTYI